MMKIEEREERECQILDESPYLSETWETIARSLRLTACELSLVRSILEGQSEGILIGSSDVSAVAQPRVACRLREKLAVRDRRELATVLFAEYLKLGLPDAVGRAGRPLGVSVLAQPSDTSAPG